MGRLITLFVIFALATFGQQGTTWKQFGQALKGLVPRVEIDIPLTGKAELGQRNHIFFFNSTDRYGVWLANGRVVGIVQPFVGRGDLKSPIWWSGYGNWGGQPVSSVFIMCKSVSPKSEPDLRKKAKGGQRITSIGCVDPIYAGGTTWMQNPFWWRQADTVIITESASRQFQMDRRTF